MKTPQLLTGKIAASLACLALLLFTGSASADNTGSGGTITYTDPTGANPVSSPPYVGGYVVHTFTASGTLTLPSAASANVLVVAGGGGGGGKYGDGGGAGGLVYSNLSLSAASYGVTIGAGGSGSAVNNYGANGTNSVFGSSLLVAQGGGGGGDGYPSSVSGQNGGSGGGSGGDAGSFIGGTGTQPASASGGYGNNGFGGSSSIYGGGGGAGAAATSYSGGVGLQYNISGVNTYYAGGGGGINGGGTGGLGGGGNPGGSGQPGANGGVNTGGGGGGGFNNTGGTGGSGIIIVQYPYVANPPLTLALTSPTNGQYIANGPAISATTIVGGGATPFTVTYYYKLTTAPTYTATAAVGPFGATNSFTQSLGALPVGAYQVYATVADSAAGTATSGTNTFTVYAAGNTGLGGTVTYTDPSGLNPVAAPPYVGGYVVQTFTTNGTLTLPSSLNADVLMVAGGGGGGGLFGSGGGAGGLIYTNIPLSGAAYAVSVGAGGNGTAANIAGANGTNSVFAGLTALGGGGGGVGYLGPVAGQNGGSGGGGGGGDLAPATAGMGLQPASASGGHGNAGFADPNDDGGGGGAGSAAPADFSSNGGDGLQYAISGVASYYAGGGGGIGPAGLGGSGVGGNGGYNSLGSPGVANTGSGGGGGWNATGGSGGSGIVIVRYPYTANPPVSVTVSSPTTGQQFLYGSSISAIALVAGGTTPFFVTYHYKLTTAGSYTATAAVGPFGSTNIFTQTLGTLAVGSYQLYATVVDSVSGTATSTTNTFTVFSTGNTGLGGTVTYTDPNGLNPVSSPPYVGGYVVQTFTANDTLILPSTVSANVLVVAGGGGGGGLYGGGGGAGGLVYSNLSLSAGTYSVTVGAGGIGTGFNTNGADGADSIFSTLTAYGGGGGGIGYLGPVAGQAGGSGGGSGGASPFLSGGTATQPSSASGGFGNNGGSGPDTSSYGGGGGAGFAGGTLNGGDGLQFAISGVTNYYAGGGGGIVGGTGGQGGGGNPGNSGAANTGGGGGGGLNNIGGNGGSGIVIVQYPYAASSSLSVLVTSPVGQSFFYGSSVPATAFVAGGTGPYSVTYYYKLTTAASYTATAAVGPFYDPNTFNQTLGAFSVVGTYQVYATVTDSAASTATSVTNTFTVSLTDDVAVQDANFETPGVINGSANFWATVDPVWNPGNTTNGYQQNSYTLSPQLPNAQFSATCPGGVNWYLLLDANTISISQDLLTSVNAGDTISLTFYGGRGRAASQTADGGVFTAAFLVGSTVYSTQEDTTVLANDSWQSYTLTQVVTNSGDLSLQFNWVSGDPWLDNLSVTRTIPSPVSVPPILGAPKVSGGNLILTGTGGTPNAGYTWLSTTNLSAPINWTTNSTGTLDDTGAFSNAIPITATPPASFFRLRLP